MRSAVSLRRARRAIVAGALLAAISASPAAAASELTITTVDSDGTSVTIDFSVPATVLTEFEENGLSIENAVNVFENGTRVANPTITPVPSNELEVVLVIDVSGSMAGEAIDAAKGAANDFVSLMPKDVAIGIVAFADTPSLTSPLTLDRASTRAAIDSLRANGETALYDAIVFAEVLFSGGTTDRQIIVLSDGGDTASLNSINGALDVAGKIRTSVVQLVTADSDTAVLEQISDANGGLLESADDPAALGELYTSVADDLLNRYRVTFPISAVGSVDYRLTLDTATERLSDSATSEVQLATTTTAATTTTLDLTVDTGADQVRDPYASGVSSAGLWLVGIGAFFFAFLLLLVFLTAPGRRTSQDLNARLARGGGKSDGNPIRSLSGLAERLLSRGDRDRALARNLDIAGVPLRPGEFVLVSILGGLLLVAVLALLMPGGLAIFVGIALTPMIARAYVQRRIDTRRAKFIEQLPDMLQTMVSSLRAGYGLPQALDVAANQSPEPTRSELQRVQFESRIGRDPGEALQSVADRMNSQDFNWVVSAMQINREVGGELALVLDNVGETVRERQKLRRQINVLTAEGRLSAYVLTALPILLAVALLVTNPDYFEPLGSGGGIVLVVVAIGLLSAGWVWIRRLVKEEN
jgi:tight adherence protein B